MRKVPRAHAGFLTGFFTGAVVAAELGTMGVTDRINALRALGTDPIRKLVVPRVLAGFFMAPVLTVIYDTVGIFGGWLVAVYQLCGVEPLLDVRDRRGKTPAWDSPNHSFSATSS